MAMKTDHKLARNARREAEALVGDNLQARVLEPSPSAVNIEPFFADDPVDSDPDAAATTVMPAGFGLGLDWNAWLDDHPVHREWVTARWLGGNRRLPALPDSLAETRTALHRLATYVIAPARHQASGKFGLRWTLGGFGTPFFGDDRQIRVDGRYLVSQSGQTVRSEPITTLSAAAQLLGTEIDASVAAEDDSPDLGDIDAHLGIDERAATYLGDWYGMAFAALELVRADRDSVDASRPQLWPGHFDPAIEVGDEDHRASYGASPGDATIDEPYLYVSVWWPDKVGVSADDPFWDAGSFTGRVLRVSEFPTDVDVVDIAAGFWRETRDKLTG
jgi:hypothetical protein